HRWWCGRAPPQGRRPPRARRIGSSRAAAFCPSARVHRSRSWDQPPERKAMAGGMRCGGRRSLSVSWGCLILVLDTVQSVPVEVRNVRVQFDVYREQSVLMDIFANRLRERAAQLGISNAEAARRSGLDERRYAHYVT